MQAVTTIGLDIAKSVFQVHGVDAADRGLACAEVRRGAYFPSNKSRAAANADRRGSANEQAD
jgi:hypothetical protein